MATHPNGGGTYTLLVRSVNHISIDNYTNVNLGAIGIGAPLDAAGPVTLGQWVELDVTAAVTGNGRASFALSNDSTNLVVYQSKEGAHLPELVVVTD